MNQADANPANCIALPRRAVIDIGSNTVRLVIYGGAHGAPSVLHKDKVAARLGRDLAQTGLLPGKARRLALDGLTRFARLTSQMGVEQVETVATAAVRDATNGQEFLDEVMALGLSPRLLSGREEAEASALGVLAAFPDAAGIAADLGGGSLELARLAEGRATQGVSLPLGTLRLPALRDSGAPPFDTAVTQMLAQAGHRTPGQQLYLVGGTLRALAHYAMDREGAPPGDAHGYELDPALAAEVCVEVTRSAPRDLRYISGISSSRAAMLPDAAALLGVLIKEFRPSKLKFSAWGLREGIAYAGDARSPAEPLTRTGF